MFLKTNLNAEKEELFAFVWLLPLIPSLAIFALYWCYGNFSWALLLIALLWFAIWGRIYQNVHTEICFEDDNITLRLRRKEYSLSITDIMYIEENVFISNPLRTRTYRIYVHPSIGIPSAYIFVRNKKIQKYFGQLFPNIPVKRNAILE